MRYVIETTKEGNKENVWNTLNKLERASLITVIEKGDPIEKMKTDLRLIARCLEVLRANGISEDVMKAYIHVESRISKTQINDVLNCQKKFFEEIGVRLR